MIRKRITKYSSIFLITFEDYVIGILTKKGKLLKLKNKIRLENENYLNPWIIKNTKELRLNKSRVLRNSLALELLKEIILKNKKLPKVNYNLYFIKNGTTTKGKRISNIFIKIQDFENIKNHNDIRIITDSKENILGYTVLGNRQTGGGIKDLNLEDSKWVEKNNNLINLELDKIKQNNLTTKYIRNKKLGEGSMGSVYLVEEKTTGNRFALKIIENKIYYLKELQSLEYLEKECNRFPCIHEIGLYSKKLAIIEELIEGQDLFDIYEKQKIKFSQKQIEQILRDLSSDLILLHSINISHRDIKAENIVIDKNLKAKFIDFGLSCLGDRKCVAVGTKELMLPRLAKFLIEKDFTPIDNSVWMDGDWYSLGIVMEELVDYYGRIFSQNGHKKKIRSDLVKDFVKITVTNEESRTIKVKQWFLKYKINDKIDEKSYTENKNSENNLLNLFTNLKL